MVFLYTNVVFVIQSFWILDLIAKIALKSFVFIIVFFILKIIYFKLYFI